MIGTGELTPSTTSSRRRGHSPRQSRSSHAARERQLLLQADRPSGADRQAIPVRAPRVMNDPDIRRTGPEIVGELPDPSSGGASLRTTRSGCRSTIAERRAFQAWDRGRVRRPTGRSSGATRSSRSPHGSRSPLLVPIIAIADQPIATTLRSVKPKRSRGNERPRQNRSNIRAASPSGIKGMYIIKAVATDRSRIAWPARPTDDQHGRAHRRKSGQLACKRRNRCRAGAMFEILDHQSIPVGAYHPECERLPKELGSAIRHAGSTSHPPLLPGRSSRGSRTHLRENAAGLSVRPRTSDIE